MLSHQAPPHDNFPLPTRSASEVSKPNLYAEARADEYSVIWERAIDFRGGCFYAILPGSRRNVRLDSEVEPQSLRLEESVEIVAQPPCHSNEESWVCAESRRCVHHAFDPVGLSVH